MIMSFQCANIQKIFLTFAAEMKKNVKQVAIIGGGAAGFFCAVCLKEALPEAEVSLSSIQPATLESRVRSGLYFVGEVLDIDGVTGGFNFQAAWTTAFVVAQSIARQ